jgi:WD40 repeat protein
LILITSPGGSDRSIKSFDLNTGQLTTEFSGHAHRVSCLQMHQTNENIVISGSNDRKARIWDARVGTTAIALVAEHNDAIRRLQFDNIKLITGGVSASYFFQNIELLKIISL